MAAHGWWWNEGKWPIIRTMQVYVSFALYPKTCDVEPTPNVQHQKRRDRRHSRRVHRLHGGVPADSRVGLTASSVTPPHCVAHLCTCASGPQFRPYAMLGYSWCGCTNGEQMRPRAAEWDEDFGSPSNGACSETSAGSGVFSREYTKATVSWDCNAMHGTITRK